MIRLHKILFFNLMILGSMITAASYSWLSMWLGMEINLMAIIPMLMKKNNKFPAEASMKYFFVQTFASTLIFYSIISTNLLFQWSLISFHSQIILNSALFMKMGAAPFHFWFPEIISGLNWMNIFIMSTWQKIAPITMLTFNLNIPLFISMVIITSSIIGGIQGLNQIDIRKIMAYSSINHTGWMISSILLSIEIWILYFSIYSMIFINITYIFKKLKVFWIQQLPFIFNKYKSFKTIYFMNFLSLGGLPPFLGFLPKWLSILSMVNNKLYFTCLILILSTLITLFFYLRLTFMSFPLKMYEMLSPLFTKLAFLPIFFNMTMLLSLSFYLTLYSIL
uniref:NADH dehydrogenase subunit 2 n=1 Tax=Odoiporus longicollis TaxID=354431 RepID=UPI0020009DD9|nr:NADH dehydrogenase subunit 2 [Odoiporus longicollis]UOL50365.1 NADH dehydrogenase subunit 2 [Odoiporus longicollis]